jgi:hypothetical protein
MASGTAAVLRSGTTMPAGVAGQSALAPKGLSAGQGTQRPPKGRRSKLEKGTLKGTPPLFANPLFAKMDLVADE